MINRRINIPKQFTQLDYDHLYATQTTFSNKLIFFFILISLKRKRYFVQAVLMRKQTG